MLGNFSYHNPTKLYFGEDSLNSLKDELKNYGQNILLVYGGGSVKKSGLYDEIIAVLKECGKNVAEVSGVMPNPTSDKLNEGVAIARGRDIDLILAVGGGSVCDYSKALSVSVYCDDDPWEKYFIRFEEPECRIIPVGCVLTMAGTGSEMNGGSVITNRRTKQKIGHVFGDDVMPRFSVLNPGYTMTLPQYQMVAGIYDIFNHICEQYFSGEDDNTSDYISEGLMRGLIHASRIAVKNPQDYEARSNIMWTATWALNTLIGKGKTEDWMVHMLGQAVGAYTDATHGMTLAAVSLPYYRHIMPYGLKKFARFATEVWGIVREGKNDEQLAEEGLSAMESWMKDIGLVMNLKDLGATEDMIEGIADATFILDGGYKVLDRNDVVEVLKESMG
ncbi:MAG: iron-containing alcohol dehydrogenase [Clostridia bacterium]|nr:iron-containing alcohol dehydrogenase [Clostridia bacterium]